MTMMMMNSLDLDIISTVITSISFGAVRIFLETILFLTAVRTPPP